MLVKHWHGNFWSNNLFYNLESVMVKRRSNQGTAGKAPKLMVRGWRQWGLGQAADWNRAGLGRTVVLGRNCRFNSKNKFYLWFESGRLKSDSIQKSNCSSIRVARNLPIMGRPIFPPLLGWWKWVYPNWVNLAWPPLFLCNLRLQVSWQINCSFRNKI